jgi:DNA-binding response OmpR family regulator
LTGLSSSVDESEAMNSGMDRFLTKPVSFKEVKKILDQWNETEVQGEGQTESDGKPA